ncbi:MAG: substrate-binding domain-containing protein [Cryobacterium sp.]
MSQPSEQMGFAMADMLLRLLAGEESVPRRTMMPAHLVPRDSA